MIIIVEKNKYPEKQPNLEIAKAFRQFFLDHQDKWVHGEDIERVVGFTSCRIYVNYLRNSGMSIISDVRKGYKYTDNKQEVKACTDKLRNRALRAITAFKNMKKML